ncbi:alpha/beta fold hydrolase [Rhizobium sp. Leaf341]|uniref:alpha/beta fold hydrolase n=1 Tax=Rhizobium sp. Leaf341 TaxID=1736344 RepID=UPI000715166D|nr:alpha/beta hydrolase [Rhizobium sp. Leaf341]KQR70831.1 hydrolase [Rhizobium sp. Leaf341]
MDRLRDKTGIIEHVIRVRDGLTIFAAEYPAAAGHARDSALLPVICLPGLSRNSRDFHGFAKAVSSDPVKPRRIVCIDYRGRGRSAWDPDPSRYQLAVEAGDVLEVCSALDIDAAIFVGTSRGGLILHLLPGMALDLSRANILNDIGPVIEIDGLLAIARYLNAEGRYPSWRAAATALKMLHGPAFPALQPSDWDEMARSLFREADGVIRPDFDPALVAPLLELSAETRLADLWPLFDRLRDRPLMVIRGETSTLLSGETVAAMGRRHPALHALTVAGQGHAPLLHLPDVIGPIKAFLATLD